MLLVAGLWAAVVFLLLPLAGNSYWPAALLLTLWFYLIIRAWQHPFSRAILHIDSAGAVRWQHASLPSGQLSHRGLINTLLLQLHWYDEKGRNHRLWLFSDQLSKADYRALARQLQIQRWRTVSKQA